MSYFHKEKATALLTLLQSAHAEQYQGLDDDMADDCSDWIESLTDDDVAAICVSVYQSGL